MSRAKKGGSYHSAKTGKFVTKAWATSKAGKDKTVFVTNK